jgi:AAA15 family ATPase/GTPase
MLLRFSVANHLSIAKRQELSLVATKLKGPEAGLKHIPGTRDLQALPSALIYGANASGKTNFVDAFSFLRAAVLLSHTKGNPEGGVPRRSFALDPETEALPTAVEVDFVVDDTRYVYGFECDDNSFLSEWLYSFPEGKRRKLFERRSDSVEFGQHMRGSKKALVDFMRSNSLFISTATQNDHEDLSKIASFFRSVHISRNVAVSKHLINNTFKKNQIDPRTIKFLKELDAGIAGYRQKDVVLPESLKKLTEELTLIARKHIGDVAVPDDDISEREKDVLIELSHPGSDGKEHFFRLEHESSGTRRLLLIMNSVFRALDQGSLVIIDELDASLHTHAGEQILKMFSDPEINQRGAQLVATTHDTNILNCKFLRRDEIWFCEKDMGGASHVFSLSDIKSRASDNFEQGYLEGRYGAIPFSGSLRALFKGL